MSNNLSLSLPSNTRNQILTELMWIVIFIPAEAEDAAITILVAAETPCF